MKALITGASSGLGKEMAIYLSRKGVDVVLVARDKEKLEEVQKMINTNCEIITMDLGDVQNCVDLYKGVKDVDILINNAGFGAFGEFVNSNLIEEIEMVNLNICALHTLTKLYLKDMVEKNSGHILNVSSIAAFLPGPQMATYHATKAYVLNLTQGIYEELRKANSDVKISCLCPGPIETPFLDRANVRFKTKPMQADKVAKCAIDNMLKGKYMILPGGGNKLVRFLSKITPNKFAGRIVYNMEEERN